ncbi:MAG: efflux RND transporter periplasmic adaptor subunit [Pseudomonadales bacterium]|nr:efflux RND transporter periplasmic adaptor subunit [Pseudomonadales bacterium]
MASESEGADKKALLNELKIDRDEPASDGGKPTKWFVLIALIGGVVFGLWFLDLLSSGELLPVKTAVARASSSSPVGASVLDATGYVVARRQATVSSKATGKVVEVLIEEGVIVAKDQLLATLDDSIPRAQFELAESQLRSAEASLVEMRVAIKQAQLDLDRTQGLATRNLASKADLDRDSLSVEALIARLERAQKEIVVAERAMAVQRQVLDDMQIRAPFAGVVIAKAAQPGEMISPVSAGGGFTRTGICTIVDMDSLEIEVDVNESYINRVYTDQPVQVTLNAYPDDNYPAEVIAIIPAADRNKATVRVRVGLLERDARVLPDMGVRVAFLDEQADIEPVEAPAGVLVPSLGVGEDESGSFVVVVEGDTTARRSVRVAGEEGDRVRVLTELANGERIVASLAVENIDALKQGASVSIQR